MGDGVTQVQIVTLIALIVFAGMLTLIGVYSAKHARTMDGFLLGGRKVGPWMSAFAYGTAYFSAVIFIGYAGKQGWDIGLAGMWIGVGNAVLGCLFAWLVLAGRTRKMTHSLNAKTMPEFFEARYKSRNMKLFAAVIIFVFLVPYSAAVYKGLGSVFNTIFPNISVNVCMLIVAGITAVFLVLGGYVASVNTDFVQGILMVIGVIVMVLIVMFSPQVGGLGGLVDKLNAIKATDPTASSLTSVFGGSNLKFLAFNILLTSMGTWGLPQMVSKFYAVKDGGAIKKATIVSTAFAALIGVGAYFVGSTGRVFLDNTLPQGGYDSVVPNILMRAMGGSGMFSTIVLAVILILLLSASMSTLSAIVLTSASAVSVDLLPVVMPNMKKERQMLVMRGLCLLFVALSFVFATMNITVIVNIMSFSWGVVSGCFIGPYVWGLYSKKITRGGAWAGMLCGFATVALCVIINTATADKGFAAASANAPVFGVAAMCVSAVVTPLVSLFTQKLPTELINKAWEEVK